MTAREIEEIYSPNPRIPKRISSPPPCPPPPHHVKPRPRGARPEPLPRQSNHYRYYEIEGKDVGNGMLAFMDLVGELWRRDWTVFKLALLLILGYVGCCCLVDSWINDGLTQMEILKRVPESVFWNFEINQ